MTKEELVEKAKKDYPVGCQIKSPRTKSVYTVSHDNTFVDSNGNIDNSGIGYLYQDGSWAEIISKPESKPQFEVGKWYRSIMDGKIWYIKLEKYQKNRVDGETISSNGIYWQKDYWSASPLLSSLTILTDLSEIQQYLPKDHPDLIPVKQDTMKESDTLRVEDLIEGEIYCNICDYDFLFIYSHIDGEKVIGNNYMTSKNARSYYKTGFSNRKISAKYRKATDEEKQWLQSCIAADKFISLADSKLLTSSTDPEYVECIKQVHTNSNPKVGEIIKATSEGDLTGICIYNSITYKECFKPSTKAAYDAQFVKEEKSTEQLGDWYIEELLTKEQFDLLTKHLLATGWKFKSHCDWNMTYDNYKYNKFLRSCTDEKMAFCIDNNRQSLRNEKRFVDFGLIDTSTSVVEQWIPQVGDWCVRLNDDHGNVKIGNVRKIIALDGKQPILENDIEKYSHNPVNLRKALPHEIPQPSIGKTVKVHVPFKLENGEWDMKAIQDECKKRYPIGCRFRTFSVYTLKKDDVVYSICGNQIYAHQMAGSLFNNGKWAELISLTESSHTMEHYIDQLPPHLKKKVKEIFNSQDIDLGEECDNIFDCINVFDWDDTCEGFDYWDTLNSLLEDDRDISNYGLPKTMSMDDLLEEAKRRYPVGSKLKECFSGYHKHIGETAITTSDIVISNGTIWIKCKNWYLQVYSQGKWAEIVTESHDHKIIDVSVQPLSMTIPLLQPLLKV